MIDSHSRNEFMHPFQRLQADLARLIVINAFRRTTAFRTRTGKATGRLARYAT